MGVQASDNCCLSFLSSVGCFPGSVSDEPFFLEVEFTDLGEVISLQCGFNNVVLGCYCLIFGCLEAFLLLDLELGLSILLSIGEGSLGA